MMKQNLHRRPWRKLVKKLQRKRRRQNWARQRDKELEEVELNKLKDPLYKSWLEQQETIARQQQLAEENEREEQEQLWLRREMIAQNQFRRDTLKRQAEEAKLEAERLKQEEKLKLLEEACQKKRMALKLQTEQAAKEFDDIMTCMQAYLENQTMKTPTRLEYYVQTRPAEKSCDFFEKTNCCRFDPGCTFNHKRPLLSKIILIKHFFQHPLLEQQEHEEYSRSDSELELSERDLRDSYDEFCEDVWPVLEEFGTIVNFRTVRNVQAHCRGHVFVEYADKRSALKAFINLQNRYYASKRLNVEFSNIRQWRAGVCGLSLGRKCPKGVKCNFLHLLKNIDNRYNKPIDNPERSARSLLKTAKAVAETPVISWNSEDILKNKNLQSRNWRWSESPEIELKNAEQNFKSKTSTEKMNASNSPRRNCKNSRTSKSDSPNLDRRKHARSPRSKSPCKSHNEKKVKSCAAEKKKELKSNKKPKHKTAERLESDSSKSKRRKSAHRTSGSPNFHHHRSAKSSRSKSSLILEMKRRNKK